MSPSLRLARGLAAMSRPDQVALIVFVYLLGVLVAVRRGGTATLEAVLAGLGALVPVAAGVHFADEYVDHETDRLTTPTAFSGGSGALERFDLPRTVPLVGAVTATVLGAAATVAALAAGWLTASAAGGIALVAVFGLAYSLPPVALAWRGLGELDNALLGGLVLPAIGVVAVTGGVPVPAIATFVPFCALVFANVLATAWPDREADAAVGKRTLAVRLSADRLRILYWAAVATAAGGLVALRVAGVLPRVVLLASLPALALSLPAGLAFTRWRSPAPSVVVMVAFAVLQAVGWLLA